MLEVKRKDPKQEDLRLRGEYRILRWWVGQCRRGGPVTVRPYGGNRRTRKRRHVEPCNRQIWTEQSDAPAPEQRVSDQRELFTQSPCRSPHSTLHTAGVESNLRWRVGDPDGTTSQIGRCRQHPSVWERVECHRRESHMACGEWNQLPC